MAVTLENAILKIACDSVVDEVDAGAAGTGYVEIRTGATIGAGTLLGTLQMQDPAFGAATTAGPSVATANAITDDSSADATGTAGHFEVFDDDARRIFSGTITATGGGGDMEMPSTSITATEPISITSFTFSMGN